MNQINSIFLIDDDKIFNLVHTKTVGNVNFAKNVKSFTDSVTALEELRQMAISSPNGLPELIFLDINMPVIDGWEFLDELNNFSVPAFHTPGVIILSSSIDSADIERSKRYKMVLDFISKPLTPSKLATLSSKMANMPAVANIPIN